MGIRVRAFARLYKYTNTCIMIIRAATYNFVPLDVIVLVIDFSFIVIRSFGALKTRVTIFQNAARRKKWDTVIREQAVVCIVPPSGII